MVTKSNYEPREVEAAKSVLLELMQILGEYRDNMVLIGGWVPFFHFGATHTGSTDIDLALDREAITDDVYNTIREHLEKRGYQQKPKQPSIFFREVPQKDGEPIEVEIDFLAGEYGGTGKKHRHQNVQPDLKARKARGCELALQYRTKIKVKGNMPNGASNEVEVYLSDVVPFIVMKGMALYGRAKEKDAWDIYYCIKHYEGGVRAFAKEFEPLKENKLVFEGLSKMRSKFIALDSIGPTSVVVFEEVAIKEERERLQRDAFEQINALLDILGITPFK
jgi:hypothetical protein